VSEGTPRRSQRYLLGFAAAAALAALLGLCIGPAGWTAPWRLASLALGPDSVPRSILVHLRLPRVLLGLAAGAALASCGAGIQAIFRNPLAEPGLIGISAGAALATAFVLGFVPHAPLWLLPLAGFLGAAATTAFLVRIAVLEGSPRIATLLLAGLAVNAFSGAAIGLLAAMAPDQALRDFTLWMFGDLGHAGWTELAIALPLTVLPSAYLIWRANWLDVLLLGDVEAGHLGLNASRAKTEILLCVVLAAGAIVAFAGAIAFIGLLIPHAVRLLIGPRHRRLLPTSAALGAALLCAADTAARSLFAPMELPVGVLTALLGGPLFLALLLRWRRRLEEF
jgi:iron complex transport system permease protein